MEGTFHLSNLWAKAYERVQDSEHSGDLKRFEDYLQKQPDEIQQSWAESNSQDGGRFKRIQIMAKDRLEALPETRTSFTLGGKRVVVREHIQKALQTIKQFKPIISGALSAEPQAALAWACILGVLPILEGLFQKDEDAADGLTKIFFMLVRYQNLEESVLTHDSEAASTHDLLSNIEIKLIDIYEKVYLYQIRFVLQYGQGKWRRNIGGILKPEDWKEKWKEIDTVRQQVDQAVQDRVGARTLETWTAVKEIETTTTETLKTVHNMDARMKEMNIKEQAAQERELLLRLPIAADAAFDSAKVLSAQSFCLEGTQHDILCKIGDWAEDPSGELILWLYSMAGTGKSSIALTVADALKHRRPLTTGRDPPRTAFLGASFFFKQVDNTRNDIQRFFTTIAWNLAEVFDDFKPLVAQAVGDNLTIGTKAPQQQLQHLLVETLSILDGKTFLPIRLIVVVDALDECVDRSQAKELISLLALQLKDLQKVQLRVLITSRREEHIQKAFSQLEEGLHRPVPLGKIQLDEEGENDDITRYIRSTLRTIARQHDYEEGKISTIIIKQLSEKANGLFIYAATACRFLDAGDFADQEDREDRLNLILEAGSDTDDWGEEGPQNHIDDIYLKVLSYPTREKLSPSAKRMTYEIMKNALGFLVTVFQPVTISSLKGFVQSVIKNREDMSERLERLLKKLQAIVTIPADENTPLELMHLSFRDFILSEERTKNLTFQVDEAEMHQKAFVYCLNVMSNELRQDICALNWPGTMASEISAERVERHIRPHLRYVCQYWVDHLESLGQLNQQEAGLLDGGSVHTFLQIGFLRWLEAMAHINETPTAILIMNKLQTLVKSGGHQELSLLVYDMRRFALSNRWIIDQAPLQMYTSALVFSPGEIRRRDPFESHIPVWIEQQPVVSDHWSQQLAVLRHERVTTFIACSPVADLLVSLSLDNTARIWDIVTGTERFTFHHPAGYSCAAFSPDGKSIALGSKKMTIDIKEFSKGTMLELEDYDGRLSELVYSPKTGSMLASMSHDLIFKIWSVDEGHAKHILPIPSRTHDVVKGACHFTPDEQYLIVGGSVQNMTMWDTRTGHCIKTFDRFDTSLVNDFKIARDGSVAALITRSTKLVIMNLISGEGEVEYPVHEHPSSRFRSIISPPDRTSVCVQRWDNDILLLFHGIPFGQRQTPSDNIGNLAAASRDGRLLVSNERVGSNLKLWDIHSHTTLHQDHRENKLDFSILGFSPEGDLAYGYSWMADIAQVCDLDGEEMTLPRSTIRKISFSPDGKFVALRILKVDDHYDDDDEDEDDMVDGDLCELWDRTMNDQFLVKKQWKEIFFSPDNSYLALVPARGDSGVEVVYTRTLERAMSWQRPDVSCAKFSPDGQIIAFFYTPPDSPEESCELWKILGRKQLYRTSVDRRNDSRDYPGIEFSPDCSFVAFRMKTEVDEDHDEWEILALATGKKTTMRWWGDPVFHPQSHLLAVGRGSGVEIRETSSLVLKQHFDLVVGPPVGFYRCGMAFSTTTGKFVSVSTNRGNLHTIIQQWDIASGSEIGRYVVEGTVNHLSYFDDTYLVCDQGRLPLPVSNPEKEIHCNTAQEAQDLLYVGHEWIYRGLERLMWLPLAYQSKISQIRGNTLALSQKGGNIRIIRFDLPAISVRDNRPEPFRA